MEEFASALRRKRAALLQDSPSVIPDVETIAADRESEIEETAQNDGIARVLSRLKERDQKTIREIDASLDRIAAGIYGECAFCEEDIGINRLRALPTTVLCIECATAKEKKQQSINSARSSASSFAASEDEFDAVESEG
jgi:DnaK suppressor protein